MLLVCLQVDAARARVAAEYEKKMRKWEVDKRKELEKDDKLRGKRKELEEQLKKYREKWDEEGERVRQLRCLVEVLVGQPSGGWWSSSRSTG
jgi:uncharacterized coiled-coil DUF342 family protein